MAFYTGSTDDGSDMRQVSLYLSENGQEFCNQPYPITRELNRHLRYVDLDLKEAWELMLKGESKASKRVQKYVLDNHKALISKY